MPLEINFVVVGILHFLSIIFLHLRLSSSKGPPDRSPGGRLAQETIFPGQYHTLMVMEQQDMLLIKREMPLH